MTVTRPTDAGMLFDGTQFALVDIGDDIGDASDLKVLGSVTSWNELGGSRATLPNPHTGIAQTDSKQIPYLISPLTQLKESTFEAVLSAEMTVEDLLEDLPGKELVLIEPIQAGMDTAKTIRLPGQLTDIATSGQMGQRWMIRGKFTPTGAMTTTAATPTT